MQTEKYSIQVLHQAIELQIKKGNDYQNKLSRIKQADYFPRGILTILDIINMKILRMYSVAETIQQNDSVNFESLQDSAIDAINYLSFLSEYSASKMDGQNLNHDIFNKLKSLNEEL